MVISTSGTSIIVGGFLGADLFELARNCGSLSVVVQMTVHCSTAGVESAAARIAVSWLIWSPEYGRAQDFRFRLYVLYRVGGVVRRAGPEMKMIRVPQFGSSFEDLLGWGPGCYVGYRRFSAYGRERRCRFGSKVGHGQDEVWPLENMG